MQGAQIDNPWEAGLYNNKHAFNRCYIYLLLALEFAKSQAVLVKSSFLPN